MRLTEYLDPENIAGFAKQTAGRLADWAEKPKDPGYFTEPVLSMGSAAAAEVVGGLRGMGHRWLSDSEGGEVVEDTTSALTYEPRFGGRQAMQDMGALFQPAIEAYAEPLSDFEDNSVKVMQDILGVNSGAAVAAVMRGSVVAIAERLGIPVKHVKKMKTYMQDHEVEVLTSAKAQGMSKFLDKEGFNADEIAELAKMGMAKRGWYKDSAKALLGSFGEADSKRFTYLLAALSPQTSVESNLKNALSTWKNWDNAGRPTGKDDILKILGDSVEGDKGVGSVLEAWQNNSFRALGSDALPDAQDMSERLLSGPKVNSFALNLMGELGVLTNDTWMARAFDTVQGNFSGAGMKRFDDDIGTVTIESPGYLAANVVQREAAEKLSKQMGGDVDPAEVQETVWSTVKNLWDLRNAPGETRNIRQIVADGGLTDEMITDTPDFGTLLNGDNEYGAIMRDINGPQREGGSDVVRQETPLHQETPRPEPNKSAQSRILGRLDQRYNAEQRPIVATALGQRGHDGNGNPSSGNSGRRRGLLASHEREIGGRPLTYTPDEEALLESLGIDPVRFIELDPTERSAQYFHDQIVGAKDAMRPGSGAGAVHPYTPDQYGDMRMFLDQHGAGGFALKDGDDIVSMFKDPRGPRSRNFANSAVPLAVRAGGSRLDAFDTVLPSLYSQVGFREAARLPWDEAEMPFDWVKDDFANFNRGEPDVVFMGYDPKNKDTKIIMGPDSRDPYNISAPRNYDRSSKRRNGLLTDDYDEALEWQEEVVRGGRRRLGWLQD